MPVVISTLQPPDRNVTLVSPSKHQGSLVSGIYHFFLAAVAIVLLIRFVSPRIASGWSWLKQRGRDHRKDYRRDILARPSGFAEFTAWRRVPAQDRKRRQAIWMTDKPAMEKSGSRGISSDGANTISLPDPPVGAHEERRGSFLPVTSTHGIEPAASTMQGLGWSGTHPSLGGDSGSAYSSGGDGMGAGSNSAGLDSSIPRRFLTRPPPPPPLTPPTLSTATFTFEDRRPSCAGSIPGELDIISSMSFIHQPNPDYMASTTAADVTSSTPSTPRRRSYTKTMPIGIPTPSSSSQDTLSTPKDTLYPSSYPSTSPLLPPPPPGHHVVAHDGDDAQGELDIHGEIISVMDDSGAGWKRHTRVYGGGVCLACLANGGEGGFYGDKVPPEHRR